jgi:hypothetical protein
MVSSYAPVIEMLAHSYPTLAQAVPHVRCLSLESLCRLNLLQVHYHIIPAPTFNSTVATEPSTRTSPVPHSGPLDVKEMHRLEREGRDELEDDDAEVLAKKIAARL